MCRADRADDPLTICLFSGPQIQLFRFHHLMLTLYSPALLSIDYPTRLLRLCLGKLSPLLEPRPLPATGQAPMPNGGGKRGKKRARGAEDGLVGGLEGRESRALSSEESGVILESLRCKPCLCKQEIPAEEESVTPLLHLTPLLAPEFLTLSIRLHLSLHLSLPTIPSLFRCTRMYDAVSHVLEEALLINESYSGTSPGWKSVILSVLVRYPHRLQGALADSLA